LPLTDSPRPGDLVQARRRRWRVLDVRTHEDCRIITLAGAGAANLGCEVRLIAPFDIIEPVARTRRVRIVTAGRWRRTVRSAIAGSHPAGGLRAIVAARLDLLPHQLEPALALVRGRGTRVLIADEVGLGKTVQTGVVLAELRARAMADRVLIVTPAGLRDQWAAELSSRFDIDAAVIDAATLRRRVSELAGATNPWTTWPVAICSIDYAKRPEVIEPVLSAMWDVLVVDEAHTAAAGTDRHAAVDAIARRAAYVVLLTATPHAGDRSAFESLCAIGSLGEGLLVFRRTRRDAGLAIVRRVHRLRVVPTRAEGRLHRLLGQFVDALRRERGGDLDANAWLAVGVLHKRAYSCAHALHQSIVRRLTTLTGGVAAEPGTQLLLPLGGDGETDSSDQPPDWAAALALRDSRIERILLEKLAGAAAAAAADETKLRAVERLLRRIAEPVVVFTEYRDTLTRVGRAIDRSHAVLHGGLSRSERSAALTAFASGRHSVLLATDAAGEGLNLQDRCRVVINLELPWNPMRLEQRIGRVDRIGQTRTVHAFHLIAAGTGEDRLLARLHERVQLARSDIGGPDPLGFDDRDAARFVIDRIAPASPPPPPIVPLATEPDAGREAARLATLRSGAQRETIAGGRVAAAPESILLTFARTPTMRLRLSGDALLIWQLGVDGGDGTALEQWVIALRMTGARSLRARCAHGAFRTFFDQAAIDLVPLVQGAGVQGAGSDWQARALSTTGAFFDASIQRTRAIAAALEPLAGRFQPGLFDRRAFRDHDASLEASREVTARLTSRLAVLERRRSTAIVAPQLLAVLSS
jgi:superfamily II DNA or RNA helicase